MFLVDVHEFDIIFAEPVRLGALKYQIDYVGRILSFQGEDVFVLGTTQYFEKRGQVDAKGNIAVASEGGKGASGEQHGDQGDM